MAVADALTDDLTRLSNRRGFDLAAEQLLATCVRDRLPAVAIMIDLDNFRAVNERHGRGAGDRVLQLFAALLTGHFRSSDAAARLGGDEFAVLCAGTRSTDQLQSLARLQAAFSRAAMARDLAGLSFSAGLAEFDPERPAGIGELLSTCSVRMGEVKAGPGLVRRLNG